MAYKQDSPKPFWRRLATAPFRLPASGVLLLESLFFGLLFRLARTAFRLLASPWGFILPLTGIMALLFASAFDKLPQKIGLDLIESSANADVTEIAEIMCELDDLGDSAVPAYIRGIALPRDEVFFPCRDAIDRRLKSARSLPVAQSEEFYLLLSEELSRAVDTLPPLAVDVAVDWSRAILRDLLRRENEVFAQRNRITARCEEILAFATRKDPSTPESPQTPWPQLLTNGEPHHWESDFLEEPEEDGHLTDSAKATQLYDRFAVERATELVAYYRHRGETPPQRLLDLPKAATPESPGLPQSPAAPRGQGGRDGFSEEMLAAVLASSTPEEKTAASYAAHGNQTPEETSPDNIDADPEDIETSRERAMPSLGEKIDISRAYIDRATTLTLDHTTPWPETPTQQAVSSRDNFQADEGAALEDTETEPIRLPQDYQFTPDVRLPAVEKTPLGRTPLEGYPFLPTTDLMRLLHHPDRRFAQAAGTVLGERDGFTQAHLRIAGRLYHPDAALRRQLPRILARIPALRPADWLRELLADPDPSVRLETVTVFGSSENPEIRRWIREQGQIDTDARVVEAVRRLESLYHAKEKRR